MDSFTADLSQADQIDVRTLGKALTAKPSRNAFGTLEQSVAEASVNVAARVDPRMRILQQPFLIARHPPKLSIKLPIVVPVGLSTPGTSVTTITIGLGPEVNAFAVIGVTAQGGIYGSGGPPREIGVFGSIGGGFWSNIGASVSWVATILFGPPRLFDGWSFGVGFDISTAIPLLSASGMAIYGPLPPTGPAPLLGIAFGIAAGPSELPADFTIQVSKGAHRPLLLIK